MRSVRTAAALLATVLTAASSVASQEPDEAGRTKLRGRVFDVATGAPIHGAFVAPEGRVTGFLTDSLGNFMLDLPSGAAYHLHAEQLGYEKVTIDVNRLDARRPILIGLRPDPVVLEGVTALVDRFERRRSFYTGSVRAYDRKRLLTGAGRDALQFVSSRTGMVRRCVGDPLDYCVWRRGRLLRMQVCIDEVYAFQGGRDLELYAPQDFYLIEVFDRGAQVRAYTNRYVERMVERHIPLRPLVMGC